MDAKVLTGLNQRAFNRFWKEALQEVVKFWHAKILKTHFKVIAYSKYPDAYPYRKKRGAPMVVTGGLRTRILGRIDVSGTSKRARGRMYMGRPRVPDEKGVRGRIFRRMKNKGETFKQSMRFVIQNLGGYDRETKAKFETMITAMADSDAEMLSNKILDMAREAYKPSGKKVRIRK